MIDIPGTILGPVLRIAGVLLIAIIASKVLQRVIDRVVKRVTVRSLTLTAGTGDGFAAERSAVRGETLTGVLKALTSIGIWVLATLVILGEVGIELAPLIAGLGIVGIALGFGAQNLVSDFVSGLFMLAEDQFGIGDIVEIDGTPGTVENVGLRTTQIRALDGMLWTLRNGEIKRIGNANKGWTRVILDIGVAYDTDILHAGDVILAAVEQARQDPDLADKFRDDPEIWGVENLGDDSVVIRLVCKCAPAGHWQLSRDLRGRIKQALDQEGIEIPFPQRTTWLRTEPDAMITPIPVAPVEDRDTGKAPDAEAPAGKGEKTDE
ncbi:MAG: mechanosensitive ion channel family protein [Actinomycetota bacterium]